MDSPFTVDPFLEASSLFPLLSPWPAPQFLSGLPQRVQHVPPSAHLDHLVRATSPGWPGLSENTSATSFDHPHRRRMVRLEGHFRLSIARLEGTLFFSRMKY